MRVGVGNGSEIIFTFFRQLNTLSYIRRGEDVEGMIRENEMLRAANRVLRGLLKEVIEKCSNTITLLAPRVQIQLTSNIDLQQ